MNLLSSILTIELAVAIAVGMLLFRASKRHLASSERYRAAWLKEFELRTAAMQETIRAKNALGRALKTKAALAAEYERLNRQLN